MDGPSGVNKNAFEYCLYSLRQFKDPSFKAGVQGSSSYEYFMDKQDQLKAEKINIDNWPMGIESVYNG